MATWPSKTMGSEAGTSLDWNTYVRDNTDDLHRRVTPVQEWIQASEATSSTTYTNLATVGPTVTATIGTTGLVLVCISAAISNTTAFTASYMSVALSGAQTLAALDANSLANSHFAGGAGARIGNVFVMSPTAGSVTFTAKYRCDAGTATFSDRRLTVIPLGT